MSRLFLQEMYWRAGPDLSNATDLLKMNIQAKKVVDQEMKNESLTESFLQYFTVDLATTQAQKESVYNIRYHVYCEEFKYEPMDRFPDKLEYDACDDHSLHCLVTHISSGKPAGCVRLIQTTDDNCDILPFEEVCAESLDYEFIRGLNLDRKTVCEISRLAVDSAFRRRADETQTRFGGVDAMDCSHHEQRAFGLIAVAGLLGATALSDLTGRSNAFAMMESFLPRLLKRSGIIFQQVGEKIEYHGIRAPFFITTQSMQVNIHPDLKELYEAIYEQIKQSYADQQAKTTN